LEIPKVPVNVTVNINRDIIILWWLCCFVGENENDKKFANKLKRW
jgi:hypothetical protein